MSYSGGEAMVLTFEYELDGGVGHSPQLVHYNDNRLRLIYLEDNQTASCREALPELGLYGGLSFTDCGRCSPDYEISLPSIKRVAHYGAFGYWAAAGAHRFVVYMMPTDISKALVDGSTQFSVGSEVSSMSCNFQNIRGELLNRNRALLTPGASVEIYFALGDSPEVSIGIFYLDRANATYPDGGISVSARNSIGKLLKEQKFDEDTEFNSGSAQDNLKDILKLAGLNRFFVGDCNQTWGFRFSPEMSLLDGINRIIAMLPDWKIGEATDGTVGIAASTDPRFEQPEVFTFQRDHSCWSYNIDYDDSDAAAKVCVYTEKTDDAPCIRVYREVKYNRWWVQPSHRTLYVKAATGASEEEMAQMADELAQSLSISGKQESFVGLFTPQLLVGDEVELIDEYGASEGIGTVTDVTHNFGRSGFYTSFTVDSGGRKGKARLSDLIGKASATSSQDGVEII